MNIINQKAEVETRRVVGYLEKVLDQFVDTKKQRFYDEYVDNIISELPEKEKLIIKQHITKFESNLSMHLKEFVNEIASNAEGDCMKINKKNVELNA